MRSVLSVCHLLLHLFFSSKSNYFDISLISLLVAHILAYGILKRFMVCMYCLYDVLFS